MSFQQLKTYEYTSFKKVSELGCGSYGSVDLLLHLESKTLMAEKFFLLDGDQRTNKKKRDYAEKEAQILAKINHPNIVNFYGITFHDNCFGIIMEFIPCGNLEGLVLSEPEPQNETQISWKIRSRFFVEIADALDYLHFDNPKVPYVHGDLKPQNILLTESLTIKLADFGAATIAKRTGSLSITTTNRYANTQHTELYTAPEFLKEPTKQKTRGMDVYSYGMVGYEIITGKRIYGGSNAPYSLLMTLIKENGQKPDEAWIADAAKSLAEGSTEYKIYIKLKNVVKQCWQFDANKRPTIRDVKEVVEKMVKVENAYDAATDKEARYLIEERKLNSHRHLQPEETTIITQFQPLIPSVLKIVVYGIFPLFLAFIVWVVFQYYYPKINGAFLFVDGERLGKCNITSGSISNLSYLPESHQDKHDLQNLQSILKVHDMVYLINHFNEKNVIRMNLSNPNTTWEEVVWNETQRRMKHIVFKDSIFAVNSNYESMNPKSRDKIAFSGSVSRYNITTNEWTQLPPMSEKRLGPSLVLFQDLLCAVGGTYGDFQRPEECFNDTINEWLELPRMNISRRDAAAVELNGELYVIGGAVSYHYNYLPLADMKTYYSHHALDVVEKYNPITQRWTKVASLNVGHIYHNAWVNNGRIYVAGGFSNMVEVYIPSLNIWREINTAISIKSSRPINVIPLE